jgi:hypothetical protein
MLTHGKTYIFLGSQFLVPILSAVCLPSSCVKGEERKETKKKKEFDKRKCIVQNVEHSYPTTRYSATNAEQR